MMMASIMGAVAFQKGLGAVHSLAHPLSSDCGMHHGTANAVLLPAVLEYNEPVVVQRIKDLFGNSNAAHQIRALNERLNIARRLRDYGVTEEILPKLADKAIEDGCHQNNPRPCTREDLLAIYRMAY
jgi:4-hydroxybutyrate dehydrogenase